MKVAFSKHSIYQRLACLACLWFVTSAYGQIVLFQLPPEVTSTVRQGSVELRYQDIVLNHVNGLGWLAEGLVEQPVVRDGEVFVSAAVLEHLGITTARLEGVRLRNLEDGSSLRVVFDFANVAPEVLTPLAQTGQLAAGDVMRVDLPALILPQQLPNALWGFDLQVNRLEGRTRLELQGGAATYRFAVLADPTRLVLDLVPEQAPTAALALPAGTQSLTLRPGVTYRRLLAPTAAGSSTVHVLEFAPGTGTFRVAGRPRSANTLSTLARGSFAAINAGYFDTATLNTIGFWRQDGRLVSAPSRGRASVGFLGGRTIIDRINSSIDIIINGQRYRASEGSTGGDIVVHTQTGASVGRADQGAIVVTANRVIDNRIGPRVVPVGGFVVVYEPNLRDLALVERGDLASLDINIAPSIFNTTDYAIEAGPLLIKDGQVAFDPALERFQTGTRLLDGRVQQAAIGVRADGTVLFVAAEAMIARELVGVFLSLGAQDAMRLDSGTSTTLFAAGQVINRGNERRIVSAIVFEPHDP